MRVIPLLLALLLLAATPAGAIAPTSAVLQFAGTANDNGAVLPVKGYVVIAFAITGTFSGTVNFEGTLDEQTFTTTPWHSLGCINVATGTLVTSATTTGAWRCNIAGESLIRARVSSYVSGAVTVRAQALDTGTAKSGCCELVATPEGGISLAATISTTGASVTGVDVTTVATLLAPHTLNDINASHMQLVLNSSTPQIADYATTMYLVNPIAAFNTTINTAATGLYIQAASNAAAGKNYGVWVDLLPNDADYAFFSSKGTLSNGGKLQIAGAYPLAWSTGTTFAALGTSLTANGQAVWCSDCTITTGTAGNLTGQSNTTCAGSGAGALAVRVNGANRCLTL